MTDIKMYRADSEALRDVRRRVGMTQESLAAASGVSRSLIAAVECGNSGASFATAKALAAALGVPVADILREVTQ